MRKTSDQIQNKSSTSQQNQQTSEEYVAHMVELLKQDFLLQEEKERQWARQE